MRNKRGFVLLATAGCLCVAGCGSSKHAVTRQAGSSATTSATDPATTTQTTKHKRPVAAKAKSHPASGPSKGVTPRKAPGSVAVVLPGQHVIPTGCLKRQGYVYTYYVEAGILGASRKPVAKADVNDHVYVDGPYKSPALAAKEAQSLNGTEFAASGGPYEVSATLRSHAGSAVAAIAACLGAQNKSKHPKYGF